MAESYVIRSESLYFNQSFLTVMSQLHAWGLVPSIQESYVACASMKFCAALLPIPRAPVDFVVCRAQSLGDRDSPRDLWKDGESLDVLPIW
jgi:hypothetical protein